MNPERVSRRDFLKLGLKVGGAVAAGAILPAYVLKEKAGQSLSDQSQETRDAFYEANDRDLGRAQETWVAEHNRELETGFTADGRVIVDGKPVGEPAGPPVNPDRTAEQPPSPTRPSTPALSLKAPEETGQKSGSVLDVINYRGKDIAVWGATGSYYAFLYSRYLRVLGGFDQAHKEIEEARKIDWRQKAEQFSSEHGKELPQFLIAIPAYECVPTIRKTIRTIASSDYPTDKFKVYVLTESKERESRKEERRCC